MTIGKKRCLSVSVSVSMSVLPTKNDHRLVSTKYGMHILKSAVLCLVWLCFAPQPHVADAPGLPARVSCSDENAQISTPDELSQLVKALEMSSSSR